MIPKAGSKSRNKDKNHQINLVSKNRAKETYFRTDLCCGSLLCSLCIDHDPSEKLLALNPPSINEFGHHYLVPDTNVFLHHMDLMEHQAISNLIITSTVLNEIKNRSISIYKRVLALKSNPDKCCYLFSNENHLQTIVDPILKESDNDRNDRAIRIAVKWYQLHLAQSKAPVCIILLSNDAANCASAEKEGITAISVERYAQLYTSKPALIDLVVTSNSQNLDYSKTSVLFDDYWKQDLVSSGLSLGKIFQGTLQISLYNALEAHIPVSVSSLSADRILIHGRMNINRALYGDVVAVELLPKEEWLGYSDGTILDDDESSDETESDISSKITNLTQLVPTGKVIYIIKKNRREVCGSVQTPNGQPTASGFQSLIFHPMDRRLPKILIRTHHTNNLVGQRITVNIGEWQRDSKYPAGTLVHVVGSLFEKKTETEVILREHGVSFEPFSQAVLADLPSDGVNWVCSNEELAQRRDLRHLLTCSIDPPGCTDIDDALHVRMLPNGNCEVGVHIADVTHFVRPGTAMDTEAMERGTTVYLVDKRIDMLPSLLGSNLCSLIENQDRLAFSCLWEMTPDAHIVAVEYVKSIIHSKSSLTYDEAQLRINDPHMQDDLTTGIRTLNQLAKKLRQRRMDNGALVLASPEVRFRLEGDAQDPIDVELKSHMETNALVEEFMLLANVSVAERIFRDFPGSAVLRAHAAPPAENFTQLNRALERFGFVLDVSSSKTLSESLDRAIMQSDPYFNQLLRIMTTRCMMQAQYFCSGMQSRERFHHYGLATPIYTHFTSPIRRYADVIVHRLLAASIASQPGKCSEDLVNKDHLHQVAENLNFRHRNAQQASRASVELFTQVYFKEKTLVEAAYVTRVLRNGISALIPKYGIEANVILDANVWKFNVDKNCLTSDTWNLQIFDPVTVSIQVVEHEWGAGGRKVTVSLVDNSNQVNDGTSTTDAISSPTSNPKSLKRRLSTE